MKSFNPRDGVPGFTASGIAAGIKKNGAKDLGLILGEQPCTAAGVFTRNRVKAAPILLCQRRLRNGKARAVLVNSGNANACTGLTGLTDAAATCREMSALIGTAESLVIPGSTGVIGVPLPAAAIIKALPRLIKSASPKGISDFADAILTTDTRRKIVARCAEINGERIKICGIAKGSGMIMPQMATMLAFIITDAAIDRSVLSAMLKKNAEETFNRISVDGESSTNDMVLALASGRSHTVIRRADSPAGKKFSRMLREVMRELSLLIVRDGEGATRLITVTINNARTEQDARRAAFRVANSPLVKTACFGGDYNWGRIMAALGMSGATFNPDRTDIYINNLLAVKNGQAASGKSRSLENSFKKKQIEIAVDLHSGNKQYEVFTCDLSYDYVKINASYKT
jgi:glutamate N-acetyltransferase / amino-acid N-acetyltransferase